MHRHLTIVLVMAIMAMMVVGCSDASETTTSSVPDPTVSSIVIATSTTDVPADATVSVVETSTTTTVKELVTTTTSVKKPAPSTTKPIENWLAQIENPKGFPTVSWFGDGYTSEVYAWLYKVDGVVYLMSYEWDHDGLHYKLGDTTDWTNEDPDEEYTLEGALIIEEDLGLGVQVTGDRPLPEIEEVAKAFFGGLVWSRYEAFYDVSNPKGFTEPEDNTNFLLVLVPTGDYTFTVTGLVTF